MLKRSFHFASSDLPHWPWGETGTRNWRFSVDDWPANGMGLWSSYGQMRSFGARVCCRGALRDTPTHTWLDTVGWSDSRFYPRRHNGRMLTSMGPGHACLLRGVLVLGYEDPRPKSVGLRAFKTERCRYYPGSWNVTPPQGPLRLRSPNLLRKKPLAFKLVEMS